MSCCAVFCECQTWQIGLTFFISIIFIPSVNSLFLSFCQFFCFVFFLRDFLWRKDRQWMTKFILPAGLLMWFWRRSYAYLSSLWRIFQIKLCVGFIDRWRIFAQLMTGYSYYIMRRVYWPVLLLILETEWRIFVQFMTDFLYLISPNVLILQVSEVFPVIIKY